MPASILVVDDERAIRELLERGLMRAGYEITLASSGTEAIERIRSVEYDVVITDIRMPGADGIAVLNATKQTAPDTEVLVATAFAELDVAIACVRGGAFDFVHKPFNVDDVQISVSRAIERRDLRATNALYRASQAILATSEPQRLPQVIVEVAINAMAAEQVSLLLLDVGERLYLAHTYSHVPTSDDSTAKVTRVAELLAVSREPLLLTDTNTPDPNGGSSIMYPIAMADRVIGVLLIERAASHPFRRYDLQRASVLASQALLALEHRRLLQHATASERLASIGQLAASVTHEVNEPVASIIANHALLREQLERLAHMDNLVVEGADIETMQRTRTALGGAAMLGEIRDVLGAAEQGVTRIRDIVREMRSLARSDQDNPTLIDLNEAVRSALHLASAGLQSRATVELDLGPDVQVLGHVGILSQVFVNLFLNAAQAIGDGDAGPGKIVITTRKQGDRVVAEVSDNGPGIAAELLPRIFEAYFTTKGTSAGGLGLAISRDIVRRYNGDLLVRSTVGSGATFTLNLPAGRTRPSP